MAASVESAGDDARGARLAVLGVALLALLPSVGTLGAPWIAEDAAILARVGSDGPWADWKRSQYGMQLLRFWRPLVSTSWAWQGACTGIAPLPLRLLNVSAHALVALLAFALARRLGARVPGAFVAGAWVALFPEQGGTSTWLAGRTDVLCALFLMASTWTALARPLASAPFAFLACAAKEFGFLAPLWVLAFARARREPWRAALVRAAPAGAAVLVAFLWRRAALGGLGGGYEAALPSLGAGLLAAPSAVLASAWPSIAMLAALLAASWFARAADRRALAGALLASGLALVPLYPLLADGHLEPENRRLLYVAECALALAVAATWMRPAARKEGARRLVVLAVAALGARAWLAWQDTHDWARSARAGEQEIERARAALARAEPGPRPVLFTGFARSRFDAYCLGFGLAERFRPPFPAAPRPVWPWRLLYVQAPERERAPLVAPRADGSIWPLDDAPTVPALGVRTNDGGTIERVERVEIDERAMLAPEDRSPRLAVEGPAGTRVEGVLFTELGYEPMPLGTLAADGTGTFSLMQLLLCSNGTATVADLLQQAADLGAERAYLELRALDGAAKPIAAGRWIELVWPRELLALSLRD